MGSVCRDREDWEGLASACSILSGGDADTHYNPLLKITLVRIPG